MLCDIVPSPQPELHEDSGGLPRQGFWSDLVDIDFGPNISDGAALGVCPVGHVVRVSGSRFCNKVSPTAARLQQSAALAGSLYVRAASAQQKSSPVIGSPPDLEQD